MAVIGYELLHRKSEQNVFSGIDDDQATAELIYNAFMVMGLEELTEGRTAFINFSKELVDSEVPFLLPPSNIVVEILERNEVTQSLIDACKKLRAKGYKLALDDFVPNGNNLPLIDLVDIVKVEYPVVSREAQKFLIRKYGRKTKFLAEKIETREAYKLASELGYHFFQGYFFSKPAMLSSREITSLNVNTIRIIEELNTPEPSYEKIAQIFEGDLGLSYKLLKLINSVYYGRRSKIKSIPYAIAFLGIDELYQWISIMMLKDFRNIENAEMIKLSLIRGKLMELIARELYGQSKKAEYFLTGLFSFIDVIMNKPMDKLLSSLPFHDDIKQALLGEENEYRGVLDCVIASETAKLDIPKKQYPINKIGAKRFIELYIEALRWAKKLNY